MQAYRGGNPAGIVRYPPPSGRGKPASEDKQGPALAQSAASGEASAFDELAPFWPLAERTPLTIEDIRNPGSKVYTWTSPES